MTPAHSGARGPSTRRTLLTTAAASAAGGYTLLDLAAPPPAFATAPSDWIDVKADYGATGDGTTDDTAAIRSALAHSQSAGGVVYFPPGHYRVTQSLTYYANTRWVGANRGATTLQLSAELYTSGPAPAHFIVPQSDSFPQGQEWSIENMTVLGPGRYVLGSAPTRTSGISLNSRARITACCVGYFFAGAEIRNDHQVIEDSQITGSYYGIDFPDTMQSWSNQSFVRLDLTGALLATVHLGGAGNWDAGVAMAVHMGGAPVCIFKTNYQDGWDSNGNPTYNGQATTRGAVTSCDLLDVWCEGVGNCVFLDISTSNGSSFVYSRWRNMGFSWNSANRTTNAPLADPEYQGAWAALFQDTRCSEIDFGESPLTAGSAGVITLTGGSLHLINAGSPPGNLLGSGSDWSSGDGSVIVDFIGNANGVTGRAYSWTAAGTISAGDIVEIAPGSWSQVTRATGSNPILGIAATPGSSGHPALVQIDGVALVNCVGNGQILSGKELSQSNTTPYLADYAANNAGARTLGFSVTNGTSPTTAMPGVVLRL